MLPVFGSDADLGVKVGLVSQLARFNGDVRPYAWRAQAGASVSILSGPNGTDVPYREALLRLDFPRAFGRSFRLLTAVSYFRTINLGYYGVGNRWNRDVSTLEPRSAAEPEAHRYHWYDATMPFVRATVIYSPIARWKSFAALAVRTVEIGAYPESLLAHDTQFGAGAGQRLYGTSSYVEELITFGIGYDSRDHETITTSGMFWDASERCAPGGFDSERFCGANLTFRGYLPIAGERLSLAVRLLGDVLSERATLLALSAYGGLSGGPGLGGSRAVRGVPQGRFAGRTKVLSNLELRSFLLPFRSFGQRLNLGAAAFVDGGRVWARPFEPVAELDGKGLGLRWGAGAGPRLRFGEALVIRADVAYSPFHSTSGKGYSVYLDFEPVL